MLYSRFVRPIRQTDSSDRSVRRLVQGIGIPGAPPEALLQPDSSEAPRDFVAFLTTSESHFWHHYRPASTVCHHGIPTIFAPMAYRTRPKPHVRSSILGTFLLRPLFHQIDPKSSDSRASLFANMSPWQLPASYLKDNGGLQSGNYRLVSLRGEHDPRSPPADPAWSVNRDQQLISRGPCVCH